MSKKETLRQLAAYIPREEKRLLVKRLLEISGDSISRAASAASITKAQLYRYLGITKRKNYPSDRVMARVLEAIYNKHPGEIKQYFFDIATRIRQLAEKL